VESFFFIVSIFILFDLALLRRRGSDLFMSTFSFSQPHQLLLGVIFLLGLSFGLFPRLDSRIIFSFFLIFILGLYFNRRLLFKRLLRLALSSPTVLDSRAVLASETLELFLNWFLWMMCGVFVSKIFESFSQESARGFGALVLFSLYSSVLMVILIAQFSRRHAGLSFRDLTGLRTNRRPFWQWLVIPFIVGTFWAVLTGILVMLRPAEVSTPFSQMLDTIDSPRRAMMFVSVAVLLAPFLEEVIFRGFLFYVIERLGGRTVAIFCVTGLFTLMHVEQYWGDIAAIAVVSTLGLMLTWLRARSGSSLPSITAHYAFNGTMTVLPLVVLLLSNPVYFEYQIRYAQMDNPSREALLLKSIQRYPQHAASYNDLAWLYAEEGRDLNQALVLAERALQLDQDQYAFLDTKAEVLYQLGRVTEAVAIEEALVERYPQVPLLRDQLGKFRAGLN
jgi:membrane protease YdiL (CAAX protease family)